MEYYYFNQRPYAAMSPTKGYYIQTDMLGTPRRLWDTAATKFVWSWDSSGSPFGQIGPNTDPDSDGVNTIFNLRFPGQYYDQETGVIQNKFRDYDTATGRYLESDLIGLGGGISTYAYVGDSPLSFSDPFGLSANCKCKNLVMKRLTWHLFGDDGFQYGHWWVEIDGKESYGWWPKGFATIGKCTEGVLNGRVGGGTATKDPHHGDWPDYQFNPEVTGEKTCHGDNCEQACTDAANCFRSFAKSYTGQWCVGGPNCHTFQEEGMKKCGLREP
jgi:RHS repeat-associated protein